MSPMKRELYPENWEALATVVKEAADWKCLQCGKQCRRPGEPFDTHKNTLTVAHLSHDESDCRLENLAPLCAPCHLKYDAPRKKLQRRLKKFLAKLKSQRLSAMARWPTEFFEEGAHFDG